MGPEPLCLCGIIALAPRDGEPQLLGKAAGGVMGRMPRRTEPARLDRVMSRKWVVVVISVLLFVLLLLAPQLVLVARSADQMHRRLGDVPPQRYGVVFGAYVNDDHTLTDAARERVEAGVLLYHQGKISRLFVSGDNRSNEQADAIAQYALRRGVAAEDVVVDRLGIDTHDTCRHLAGLSTEGLLLTQGYHLPRALYMCERDGLRVEGLAVNRLGLLAERGSGPVAVWTTRTVRFAREAAMTWSFVLGLYDKVSDEAERLEGQ